MTRSLRSTVATVAVVAGLTLPVASQAQAEPRVVASIPAVHSLVAGVMQGVGTPELLIQGGASPHTYSLKPSQARALQQADAIFWIGDDLESFLTKPLRSLGNSAAIVNFSESSDIRLLNAREGGAWEGHGDHGAHGDEHEGHGHGEAGHKDEHDHDHGKAEHKDEHDHGKAEHKDEHGHGHGHAEAGHKDEHDGHAHGEKDLHIWLDPENAIHMVEAIVAKLRQVDPVNAATYAANGAKLETRLEALENSIRTRLAPVKDRPYLVFHDAYHYFEERFGTKAVGSLTVAAERKPGARRLSELREKIEHEDAVCVFAEPQFQPAIVRTLVAGTKAKAGVLDPVGANIAPGPEAYFTLMENLANSLANCLTPSS